MRCRLSTVLVALLVLGVAGPASADPGEEPDEDLTPPVLRMTPKAGAVDGWYADTATIDVVATDNHTNATGIFQVTWTMSGAENGSGAFPVRAGAAVAAAPPVVTGTAKARGGGRVKLTVTVGGVDGVEPTGEVTVRRGAKVVGRGSLSGGVLVLTLKKQRPGRTTYTVSYAGAVGIETGTAKVKVKVR